MPRVEASIEIKRPVAEVFQFVENPANDSIWRSGMTEGDPDTSGPVGVGTTGREVWRALGREFETTWEITEYEPNQKVAYRSTSGPFEYEGSWRYEAIDGGTRLSVVLDWTLTERELFGRLPDSLIASVDQKTVENDLRALKRLLEA